MRLVVLINRSLSFNSSYPQNICEFHKKKKEAKKKMQKMIMMICSL